MYIFDDACADIGIVTSEEIVLKISVNEAVVAVEGIPARPNAGN